MNHLVISPRHLHAIGRHAAKTYPGECSGVLIGRPARNGVRKVFVQRILAVQAPHEAGTIGGDPVAPETRAAAEHQARAAGLEVVGFYLARAGSAATPAELEVELRPGLSYLLTAIDAGAVVESRSWCVHADGRLEEEAVDASAVAPLPGPDEAIAKNAG
jgi:proteasome lid subunit RPN8/RPN11